MGQSKTQVSVVIPAYNAEQYLPEQLEALLNNTVSIAEIIVSDNGSTDSTKDLVLKAAEKHENVKYLDAGQRQGPNYARNKGIEQASHELVLLCDADDIVAEDWAEKLLGALETADLVGSGYYTYLFSEVSGRYEISSTSIEQPTVFNDQVYSLSCSMGVCSSMKTRQKAPERVGSRSRAASSRLSKSWSLSRAVTRAVSVVLPWASSPRSGRLPPFLASRRS